jgi:hypothetical protein
MRPSRILVRAAVVASAALLSACVGRDIAAPDLTTSDGTPLLVPSDGPSRNVTADGQPIIRIGVVQSSNTITLGSAADYVVRDKPSGLVLFSGHAGSVAVTLLSANVPKYRLQIVCGTTAAVPPMRSSRRRRPIAFSSSTSCDACQKKR